jgi:hypothetical protein
MTTDADKIRQLGEAESLLMGAAILISGAGHLELAQRILALQREAIEIRRGLQLTPGREIPHG